MNVDDAAYAVVHDYPGGADSLAPRMGKNKSPVVLRSKVNPRSDSHHLTLREAVAITVLTDDDRILQAFAQECGRMVLPLPSADDTQASDMAVLELVVSVMAGQGDLGGTIHRALADGRLTRIEFAQIEDAANVAQRRIAALMRRLAGMVDGD